MSKLKYQIYNLVKRIPKGKIATYKEIAEKLGNPKLARYIGNALSKNCDFKNIPCHRVIRSDGRIGGYVLGEREKIKRLKKEGIEIKGDKVIKYRCF